MSIVSLTHQYKVIQFELSALICPKKHSTEKRFQDHMALLEPQMAEERVVHPNWCELNSILSRLTPPLRMFGGLMIIELSIKQGLCLCYNRLCGSRVSRSSVHTLPSRTDQSGAPYVSNAPVITKSSWSIMRGDVECKRARRGGIYIYTVGGFDRDEA